MDTHLYSWQLAYFSVTEGKNWREVAVSPPDSAVHMMSLLSLSEKTSVETNGTWAAADVFCLVTCCFWMII